MKTNQAKPNRQSPTTTAARERRERREPVREFISLRSLSSFAAMVLLLTLPAAVQAQDYTYTTNNGTITITGYTGPGGDVTIPSTITGLPVTSIGSGAFWGCTSLTNVIFGNGVTNIGWAAFSNCRSLTSITLPDSVINIGGEAFHGCTSLTNVTIGSSVTNIGPGPFWWCTSLMAITVATNNPAYSSLHGVLFNKPHTVLLQYPAGKAGSDYTIPNSVTNIWGTWYVGFGDLVWWGAFSGCTSLTSVTIPDSVTSIGDAAFYWCYSLTNVTIGNGVSSIGVFAFDSCSSLTSVTIPNSVTSIGGRAFCECYSLTNVTIGNGVISIGGVAFADCSLTSVTIPASVTNIGASAFSDCTSLASVYFKGNAPSLGSGVFAGDNNATAYYLPGTTGWGATFGDLPTALWFLPNPLILNNGPSFGIQTNRFGFIISWATNVSVVVEASTTLANPTWLPVSTNTLTDGWSYFSDPGLTNYPARFYRLRSP